MRSLLPLLIAACAFAAPTAPKKKPEPIKPLTPAQKSDYTKVVQPMFDAQCVSCHGPKKEKGKLRLDTLEATLKGGKNLAFVIGRPNDSMLLARVFLGERVKRITTVGLLVGFAGIVLMVSRQLGGAHGAVDGGGIVTIDRGDHIPAIGCKACRRVVGEPAFDMAIDRDAVVVIEGNQL